MPTDANMTAPPTNMTIVYAALSREVPR